MTDTSVPDETPVEEPKPDDSEPQPEPEPQPEEYQPPNPPHWTTEEPPADEDAGTSA